MALCSWKQSRFLEVSLGNNCVTCEQFITVDRHFKARQSTNQDLQNISLQVKKEEMEAQFL